MKQVLLVLPGQRMPWKDAIMPCNRCLLVINQPFGRSYMALKRTCSNRKLHCSKRQPALFINREFRILTERVVRAVATFAQSEILIYLRSIAHLSHS